MNKIYYYVLLLLFTCMGVKVNASHLIGGEINYMFNHASDTVTVQLVLYRDCAGITVPVNTFVEYSDSCGTTINIPVSLMSTESFMNNCCTGCSSLSQCNGGILPGYERAVYEGYAVVGHLCGERTFSYDQCCRHANLANLTSGSNSDFYLEAQYFDSAVDNSPQFNLPYTYATCLGSANVIDFSATDPDGDSLVYSLIDAKADSNVSVSYVAGYSGVMPIQGMTIDSTTGFVSVTPNLLGTFAFVVKVSSYNSVTGEFKGSIIRDFPVVVENCGAGSQISTSIDSVYVVQGGVLSNDTISISPDDSMTLGVLFSDSVATNIISFVNNSDPEFLNIYIPDSDTNILHDSVSISTVGILPGFYRFSGFVIGPSCRGVLLNLTINVLPYGIAGANQTICQGDTHSFQLASPNTANWSVISGDTSSLNPGVNGTTVTVDPGITSVYRVVQNNDTDFVTINVIQPISAAFSGDTVKCSGSPSIVFTPVNPGGVYSGNWVTASGVFTADFPGVFNVSYIMNQGLSCQTMTSQNIEVFAVEVFDIVSDTVCVGSGPQVLQAGNGNITWYQNDTSNAPTSNVFYPSINGVGVHPVFAVGNVCGGLGTGTIYVEDYPVVSINNNLPEICSGSAAQVDLNNFISVGNSMYNTPVNVIWDTLGAMVNSQGILQNGNLSVGSHTINGTVSLDSGCDTSFSIQATVVEAPQVQFTDSIFVICLDGATALNGNYTHLNSITSPSDLTFTWSDSLGIITSTGSFNAQGLAPGMYPVTLNATSATSCGNSWQAYVQVTAPINPIFEEDLAFCENESVGGILTGSNNIVSINQTIVSGGNYLSFTNDEFSPLVSGAGIWLVDVYVTDSNGCLAVANDTIQVFPATVPALNPDLTFCVTDQVQTVSNDAGLSYYFTQQIISGADTIQFNNMTFEPQVSGAGQWKITLYVNDSNGCSASSTDTINVLDLPSVSVSVFGDTLEVPYASGNTYQWYDCNMNAISGATNNSYVGAYGQGYQVEVSNAACIAVSTCANLINSIEDVELNGLQIKVYPNPATNRLAVELPTKVRGTFSLMNVSGARMQEVQLNGSKLELNIENYSRGIYLIKITSPTFDIIQKVIFE